MTPPPRLVASDLDGTLFGPDHELATETIDAVRRLVARGVPLVAATGRSHHSSVVRLRPAGVIDLAVGSNGATVYDLAADRITMLRGIEPAAVADTVSTLRRELPGLAFAWETPAGLGAEPRFAARRDPTAARQYNPVAIETADLTDCLKLMAIADGDAANDDGLLDAVRALAPEAVTPTSSGIGFVEITGAGVTKASTLAIVAEQLGIDPAEVTAFGDQPNDIEMLRWAGWGVAMGNAHDEVKAVADEVIGHHADHAVAAYLDTLAT